MSIAANFLWFPITIFLVIFLAITLFTFIKFGSLRNYRKKRNWLFYAFIILVAVLAAYFASEDLIGPAIISYETDVDGNTFYADQINKFDITCTNNGMRATDFNFVIRAVNASLIIESSQDCDQINNTLVKIPFTLQTPKETQNLTIHFAIDQNTSTCAFYFTTESQAYIMNSHSQLHFKWNSTSCRFDAYTIFAPC